MNSTSCQGRTPVVAKTKLAPSPQETEHGVKVTTFLAGSEISWPDQAMNGRRATAHEVFCVAERCSMRKHGQCLCGYYHMVEHQDYPYCSSWFEPDDCPYGHTIVTTGPTRRAKAYETFVESFKADATYEALAGIKRGVMFRTAGDKVCMHIPGIRVKRTSELPKDLAHMSGTLAKDASDGPIHRIGSGQLSIMPLDERYDRVLPWKNHLDWYEQDELDAESIRGMCECPYAFEYVYKMLIELATYWPEMYRQLKAKPPARWDLQKVDKIVTFYEERDRTNRS